MCLPTAAGACLRQGLARLAAAAAMAAAQQQQQVATGRRLSKVWPGTPPCPLTRRRAPVGLSTEMAAAAMRGSSMRRLVWAAGGRLAVWHTHT